MYELEILQGTNKINVTDTDIGILTQFIYDNIDLFGPETKFTISAVPEKKK